MTITDFVNQLERAYGSYESAGKPGMIAAISRYVSDHNFSSNQLSRLFTYTLQHTSTLYGNRPTVESVRKDAIAIGILRTGPPEFEKIDYEKPFTGDDCEERRKFLQLLRKMKEKRL